MIIEWFVANWQWVLGLALTALVGSIILAVLIEVIRNIPAICRWTYRKMCGLPDWWDHRDIFLCRDRPISLDADYEWDILLYVKRYGELMRCGPGGHVVAEKDVYRPRDAEALLHDPYFGAAARELLNRSKAWR